MSLRSVGVLARQRRGVTVGPEAAPTLSEAAGAPLEAATPSGDRSVSSLEAAIPTEVIALYSAIIAGCQAVLGENPKDTFLTFRVVIYAVALVCTVFVALRNVTPATDGWTKAARSPEVLTATMAFAAWGLIFPGSFLFVWISGPVLSIIVITVTAAATFLLAVVFAPRLRSQEQNETRPSPPLTQVPP
jgi:hypothetical protein